MNKKNVLVENVEAIKIIVKYHFKHHLWNNYCLPSSKTINTAGFHEFIT